MQKARLNCLKLPQLKLTHILVQKEYKNREAASYYTSFGSRALGLRVRTVWKALLKQDIDFYA